MIRLGGAIVALLMLVAVAAPWLAPHDPNAVDLGQRLRPPSLERPLGADRLGRDQLSRIIYGARNSLGAAMLASGLALGLGLGLGLLAAMLGGRWDGFLMRLVDVGLAFPGLVLALALAGAMGPSLLSVCLGAAAAGWAWWARFTRGLAVAALARRFVVAGQALGLGRWAIARRYVLPEIAAPILVAASLKTGWMIVAISGLGYLGLGAQPPTPEWGAMLHEARANLARAPWLMLAPGLAITATVLGCNLLAEGLRDRLQVRQDRDF
ncbi:binding-protein-dependent transport systems inner membrane component [Desulfarculus baarsii DSM 2075]|uniref:Binding-protein-dependent transport systems inner membrane component n=1 Tax=Desulfarculus baarsii (strain ATCC 33931 / DSM 2075 / LMG 7858 / VKM B-1802 / 2st14) TaxID=644282 RepID=E1QHJ2_DESB2|nr:ABC transporter permease subunit [Desulfarculus baarsii]ADK85035.1 binding-protein-dependent transport systems inner membrane component [Desulfarculus baarsii DSM 2075]